MADSLTDEQLIDELQSYGEKISLPIKPNRRPILIKKLNHLRTRNKPPPQKAKGRQTPPRRTLNLDAFSSDDSDAEPVAPSGQTPNAVDPGASRKITEVVKRSLRRRPNVSSGSPIGGNIRSRIAADSTIPPPADSPDRDLGGTSFNSSRRSTFTARNRRDVTPEPEDTLPVTADHTSRLYPDLSVLGASTSTSSARDSSLVNRSRRDTFESSDSDFEGSSYEVENKSVNTSFGLLRNRRSPASNHVTPNRNYSPYSSHSSPASNHVPDRASPSFRGRAKRRFYPEYISLGLVGLALLFFVVVGSSYVFVRKGMIMGWIFGDSPVHGQGNNLLLCPDPNAAEEEDCCYKHEVEKARNVIQELYRDLSRRKGLVECGYAEEATQRLSRTELRKQLALVAEKQVCVQHSEAELPTSELNGQEPQSKNVDRLLKCCLHLIMANPHWNIRVLDRYHGALEKALPTEVSYLESAVADMSFFCRLRRSFSRVLWSIFVLVAGVAGLGVLFLLLWWRIQAKDREEQKVFAMVEQIIDLLKEQHEFARKEGTLDQATGLAVQHVRDQLLPPATRKANQHIWDKAVKFIEANESRVRLETQVIEGEEFAVWRWIQAVPNGGKVWQGQAFGEHNDNNSTASIYSPTPCLKIRNMFDKEVENEDDWEESVKDALLEKCRDIKSLVHIYVDKNSREGCVYVKCNSKEAAGLVRQALHGWWFDGRLVTVKHLKVEHYHNRWPEAKFAWRPLQPSTDQMRSLAQPYYRSSLEMT